MLAVSACGQSDEGKPRLVVSAAASLSEALTSCSRTFRGAQVQLSFAGSNELAAQIRRGVKPDVFAAANMKLPLALNEDGLIERPVAFATNELVLAVPSGSSTVQSVDDLARPGTKLVIGSASEPVGSYTREVLSRLPPSEQSKIVRNVRSDEPDVKGVVGKLTQGAADAGFVYSSDVEATEGKLDAVRLTKRLQPTVAYGAGVVKGAKHPAEARRYVNGLRSGACANTLRRAGFGPPPSS